MSDTGVIVTLSPRDYNGVLFDLDGVLTATASVHAAAWKKLFDAFLERRAAEMDEPFVPFDIDADYRRYVDGKPRHDGVAAFLAARSIELPAGTPEDGPRLHTVHALGNLKDQYFMEHLQRHGLDRYEDAISRMQTLRAQDVRAMRVAIGSDHAGHELIRSASVPCRTGPGIDHPRSAHGSRAGVQGARGRRDVCPHDRSIGMIMRLKRMLLVLGVIITTLSGSVVSTAQTPAGEERSQFRFEFEEAEGRRGLGVEGWVYNSLAWRVTDVWLRVDCVDANGTVTASAAGWAVGDELAGGRSYFFVPIPSRAATYRVTVQSFHKVSREAPPQAP